MTKKEKMFDLYEAKSKYGNTYYYGYVEGGGKVIMQKQQGEKNGKGHTKWTVFLADRK